MPRQLAGTVWKVGRILSKSGRLVLPNVLDGDLRYTA
jgi:hypothetical protein